MKKITYQIILVLIIIVLLVVLTFVNNKREKPLGDPLEVVKEYYNAPKFFEYDSDNEASIKLHSLFTKELSECIRDELAKGTIGVIPEAGYTCGLEDAGAFHDPMPFDMLKTDSAATEEFAVVVLQNDTEPDLYWSIVYELIPESGTWKISSSVRVQGVLINL